MFHACKIFWTEAFNFRGTTSRKDFWLATLAYFIAIVAVALTVEFNPSLDYLQFILVLVTTIPFLSLTIRRLHDIGKRWYYILLAYIPIIGDIWLIVLLAQPSQQPIID